MSCFDIDFRVFVFLGWIVWSIVSAARKAQKRRAEQEAEMRRAGAEPQDERERAPQEIPEAVRRVLEGLGVEIPDEVPREAPTPRREDAVEHEDDVAAEVLDEHADDAEVPFGATTDERDLEEDTRIYEPPPPIVPREEVVEVAGPVMVVEPPEELDARDAEHVARWVPRHLEAPVRAQRVVTDDPRVRLRDAMYLATLLERPRLRRRS